MNSKVQVIIPSYNHGSWIKTAIESVCNQSYNNFSLLVIDDYSTDNSREIIVNLSNIYNFDYILKDKNRGWSDSILTGLKLTSSDYLCILPSDDYYLPDYIKCLVNHFNLLDRSYGVVYCNGYRYYEKNKKLIEIKLDLQKGNIFSYLLLKGNCIYPATPMFRTSILDANIFNTSFTCEGEAIYLYIAERYKFSFVTDYLLVMREHEYNSGNNFSLMYEDNLKWWTIYFEKNNKNNLIYKYKNLKLSKINLLFGFIFIENNLSFKFGRKLLFKSISQNFINILNAKIYIYLILSFLSFERSNKFLKLLKGLYVKFFKKII